MGDSIQILYLDFDGVLHPAELYWSREKGLCLRDELTIAGHSLFENQDLLAELIAPYKSLKIVLSTSWVSEFGISESKKRLCKELQHRVIGSTLHSYMETEYTMFDRFTRFGQIMNDVKRRRPSEWLAIDDQPGEFSEAFKGNFVVPFDAKGLANTEVLESLTEKLRRFEG